MIQRGLFEVTPQDRPGWHPPEPPFLHSEKRVYLDFESTGLRWWRGDRPVGVAVATPEGRSWYLPFAHAGGNLDEGRVKDWMRRELAGKEVGFFNAPWDVNMGYTWGVDLEAIGCRVFDVGNYAALLEGDRWASSSLNAVSQKYLNTGKITGIDTSRMKDYHAADVAEYAQRDVLLLVDLDPLLRGKIQEQELNTVATLENDLIPVTCSMMRQGTLIDEEKLHEWIKRSEKDFIACLWEIHKQTGLNINVVSRPDLIKLFERLKIPPPMGEKGSKEEGNVTFKKDLLKQYDHPVLKTVYRARMLSSLRSKYLLRYAQELKLNGCLRYSLHQMRVDDDGGTISGRYSCSSFGTDPDEGINIQQVAGKKHARSVSDDAELSGYKVRELYVPAKGKKKFKGDAEQIEYRFFAHYAKPPKVLAAYAENPHTDFHNVVWEMLKTVKKDITRDLVKDCNFAALYGAGVDKWARMMGITEGEARKVYRAYHHMVPEAKRLLDTAMDLARKRGYVRTILGRRARFEGQVAFYSALNRVIQGSAADEMKIKLLELHRRRRETGFNLQFTVHDEVVGDVHNEASAKLVTEILNTQMLNTRVPLFWKTGTGANWKEC
jgi:DNA polymerase-1